MIIFLLGLMSASLASTCEPVSREQLRAIVEEVRDTHFPELKNRELPFSDYKSDEYFFQATVKVGDLLRGRKRFCIDLNQALLDCPPSLDGLRAIIVHELRHFADYEAMSVRRLYGLGIRYATSKRFRREYERATDQFAVELGHGAGLIEYREWLYGRLEPKALKKKQYYYLSPDEIRQQLDSPL
jgi:hypothetical protein